MGCDPLEGWLMFLLAEEVSGILITIPDGSPVMEIGVVPGVGGLRLADGAMVELVMQSNSLT